MTRTTTPYVASIVLCDGKYAISAHKAHEGALSDKNATPRTDAEAFFRRGGETYTQYQDGEYVRAGFARQLERELNWHPSAKVDPVAWRYKQNPASDWRYLNYPPAGVPEDAIVEPLYAHQSAELRAKCSEGGYCDFDPPCSKDCKKESIDIPFKTIKDTTERQSAGVPSEPTAYLFGSNLYWPSGLTDEQKARATPLYAGETHQSAIRRRDEALEATVLALRIISAGEPPYASLPLEVRETCGNAADYLGAADSCGLSDKFPICWNCPDPDGCRLTDRCKLRTPSTTAKR